jgi:hypothetical protein
MIGRHPDGWSWISNFHIFLARVRTMIGRRPDGWSWIRNFHICWTRVRTMLTDVRTVVFELPFLPYVWARPNGNPRRPDGCINLPLFELGKKIWSWSIIGRHPDGLLRCPDGCKLELKLHDTVEGPDENPRHPDEWCLVCRASRRNGTSSGQLELVDRWASERDGTSSERLSGNRFFLICKQCRNSGTLLNSGIPVKKHVF